MVLFYAIVGPAIGPGCPYTLLGYPVAPGWDTVKGRTTFYAHAPSFGAGGTNGRMTLTAAQSGAT